MNMVWLHQPPRYRCPLCRVIYFSARAVCAGGVPVYDPQRPGETDAEHDPTAVVPDPQTPERTRP